MPLDHFLAFACDDQHLLFRRRFAARVCAATGLNPSAMFDHMGLGPATVRDRLCLRCGRSFESDGPNNRICYDCKTNYPTVDDWNNRHQ